MSFLTLDENSSLVSKEGIKVEFIRFAYDVEKAATAVEERPLPDEFAEGLRKAYKTYHNNTYCFGGV